MTQRYVLTVDDTGQRSWQPELLVVRIFHVTDSAGQCLLGCPACAAGLPRELPATHEEEP